jgi:hypothetical protein
MLCEFSEFTCVKLLELLILMRVFNPNIRLECTFPHKSQRQNTAVVIRNTRSLQYVGPRRWVRRRSPNINPAKRNLILHSHRATFYRNIGPSARRPTRLR